MRRRAGVEMAAFTWKGLTPGVRSESTGGNWRGLSLFSMPVVPRKGSLKPSCSPGTSPVLLRSSSGTAGKCWLKQNHGMEGCAGTEAVEMMPQQQRLKSCRCDRGQ